MSPLTRYKRGTAHAIWWVAKTFIQLWCWKRSQLWGTESEWWPRYLQKWCQSWRINNIPTFGTSLPLFVYLHTGQNEIIIDNRIKNKKCFRNWCSTNGMKHVLYTNTKGCQIVLITVLFLYCRRICFWPVRTILFWTRRLKFQ